MNNDWQKLNAADTVKLLDTINPFIEPVAFSVDKTSIRQKNLPFYKSYKFYEITDMSAVPAARKYALASDKDVYMVNWTNAPIYEINESGALDLNDKTIRDYVRFFFSYVRGRHGRFLVVEAFDDIKWQNEPPPQGRKVMQDMLHPVVVLNQDPDGTYNLEAFMVFKDALFRTLIHVAADGTVSMSDEELKVEGMPVIQDAMIA